MCCVLVGVGVGLCVKLSWFCLLVDCFAVTWTRSEFGLFVGDVLFSCGFSLL